MFNRCSRFRSVLAASFLGLILLVPPQAFGADEDPSISLVKTLVVREINGRPVSTEEYIVQKGDSIARLLIDRGSAEPGKIPNELVKLVLALNPGLHNPNLIFVGQKLVLPSGPLEGSSPETAADQAATAEKAAAEETRAMDQAAAATEAVKTPPSAENQEASATAAPQPPPPNPPKTSPCPKGNSRW